jgi:hypothetical protein
MAHRSARPLVFFLSKLKLSNMTVSKLRRYRAIVVFTDLSLLLVYWKSKPPSHDIYCVYLTVTMAPVVRIEPNDSEFFFFYIFKPVIAYLRHVFAGGFLGKRLRIWGNRQKPISEMGSFTFHMGSFPETGPFQRYVSFFGGKNLRISVAVEVSVFFFFLLRDSSLLMVFLGGFKLYMPFYLFMSLCKMSKIYQKQSLNPLSWSHTNSVVVTFSSDWGYLGKLPESEQFFPT